MYQRHSYKSNTSKPWTEIKNPVATHKYDGANFHLVVDDKGAMRYFSRAKAVDGTYPERTEQLPHLASKKLPQFAGHVYNVELIHTGKDPKAKESHGKLSGILNSLTPRSLETQKNEGPVRAVLINVTNPEIGTYKEKLLHLKQVEKTFGNPDLMFVPTPRIIREDIVKLINSTKAEGREGVIVTSLTEPEYSNPRIKIVHTNMYNLRVVKVNQEIDIYGKPKKSMGSLTVVDKLGRIVGNVGTGFSREDRIDAWENPKNWVGKLIQVKARDIVRAEGLLKAPVYNGFSDGEIDTVNFNS